MLQSLSQSTNPIGLLFGMSSNLKIEPTTKKVSLDIRDPDFYNDPYPTYETLQSECPMFFWQEHELWTFTKHDDVSAILRDRRFGRQISHLKSKEELGLPPTPKELKPFFDIDQLSMLGLEPPEHTRLRGLVQKAFMTRQIELLRPNIEALCNELLEKMESLDGSFDLLKEYATPIPVLVIAEMLGVPTEMAPELLRWSHAMVQMYEMKRTTEMELAAVNASQEFVAYLRSLVAARKKRPAKDLISQLIAVTSEGEKLTEDELVANCILLLNAGHEATVNVIGNGMFALMSNVEQMEAWRQDDSITKSAVEELIRFDTPLHQFNRWVLEPLELHGQSFSVGQEIALLLGAANRDVDEFENPHQLNLLRSHNPHVSLGGGIHYCLGAPLARLEIQIAIPLLICKFPDLKLAESPRYRNNFHFHGLESLLVHCG